MATQLWEDEIFGKVRRQDWLDIGSTLPVDQSDPIESLFRDEKTDNIVARWEYIASQYRIPVMAEFHGFDAEANTALRIPVNNKSVEKGLIKEKKNQSERLRELNRSGVVNNQELYNYVMADGLDLARRIVTRTKVAKNEVLATGKMTIHENNVNLVIDYGVPASNTRYTLDLSKSADIASQIRKIVKDAREQGVTLTGMVTSDTNIQKMLDNENLQKSINGNIGAGAMLYEEDLANFLTRRFGINKIISNDLLYAIEKGIKANGTPDRESKRYYPENKVTFFASNPAGNIGAGLWGDPPEIDMDGFYPNGRSEISPYVYITQKMEWDPAVLWTKASSLFVPVIYNPDGLFIATVDDDGV